MANEFNVGINVSSNGTLSQVEKEAKAVNKQLKDMATNSTAASSALKSGGTTGSKKAAYQAETMDNTGYRNLRGVSEATGASSRDFARQAQGLGGLVHVYATFAANLFAVSAAFTALKNAADTTNMIKGLDQLGAASGRNLGQLSKNVAALSDGAVSLREAMTATAQATSAGMSNKNLERLTLVAKNASQALGLNMPDALSRLSRGITKIEPELLDELGLFVKVDEASNNYARSVGKTAASLTDFEKRQAFANAAIEQGELKFSSISMVANPYSKLSASISDLGQTILEFINKGLGPLMNMLSQSPAALGVALAGIAGILLKQAIPAIGQYRQNAKLMAEETHSRVVKLVKDQQLAYSELDAAAAISAENRFKNEASTIAKIDKLKSARFSKEILGEELRGTLKKSAFDITPAETSALKARSETLLASDDATYKKQGQKLATHLKSLDALREQSNALGDAAAEANEKRDAKWYSHQSQLASNLDKLNKSAAKSKLLAGVADTAAILGPTAAFKQLSAETAKLDASPAAKSFVFLQGALSTVASAVGTAIGAFSGWITLIGLVVSGVTALVNWLSNTTKETELTKQAMVSLDSSVANVARTIEALKLKPAIEQLSIDSIQARATAFGELGDSIALAAKRAYVELGKMGSADTAMNWAKGLIGSDVISQLQASTGEAIVAAFSVMEKGSTKDKVSESIKNMLGIESLDTKSIEKAFDGMSEAAKKANIENIGKALKAAGEEARITAAKGTELKQGFAEATKQLQDLRNSFLLQDEVSKFGNNIVTMAGKMDLALKDPVSRLNAMEAAVKDANALSFFPPDTAARLIGIKSQVDELKNSFTSATREVDKADERIAELSERKTAIGNPVLVTTRNELNKINKELAELQNTKEVKTNLVLKINKDIQELSGEFESAVKEQFVYGAKVVSDKLAEQWAKAGNVIGSTIAGLMGDTKAGIELRAKYEVASLTAQSQVIQTQLELIQSNERLAIALEQNAINEQKKTADTSELRMLAEREKQLTYRKSVLDSKITKGSTAKIAEDIGNNVAGAKESLKYVQQAEAAYAQIANIGASISAVAIKQSVELIKKQRATQQEQLDRESESVKHRQDALAIIESIAGAESLILLSEKQGVAEAQAKYEANKKIFEIDTQIAIFRELERKASKSDKPKIAQEIEVLNTKKEQVAKLNEEVALNVVNKGILSKIALQAALVAKEDERSFNKLRDIQTAESSRIDNAQSLITLKSSLGLITQDEAIAQGVLAANLRDQLETQMKLDTLTKESGTKILGAETKQEQARSQLKTATPEEALVLNQIILEQDTLIKDVTESTNVQTTALIAQLGVKKLINDETAKQASIMSNVASATQSLTAVFGELGTSIGASVKELSNFMAGSSALDAVHTKSMEGLVAGSDDYTKQELKNTKERQRFDITATANMAGAAKKLFKEKSTGYKVLAGIEKTMHLVKLAMDAKELAVKLASLTAGTTAKAASEVTETAITEAGFMARMGTYVMEIFAKFTAMMGPFGPPAAAAVIAAIGLAAFKGSNNTQAAFGMNSEQRQETQGTGYTYDAQGNKVETGGGVFGDASAKSASIDNSLKIIKDNSIAGLDYDNRMLRAMQAVADAMTGAATALYAVPGLRSGGSFGTLGGTTSSKGGLAEAFASIPLVGGVLGGAVGSMFGGGTSMTASIESAGIQIQGSFEQVMNDLGGSILQYKDVLRQYHEDGGWFGSDSDWTTRIRETQALAGNITDAISDVYKQSYDMFTEVSVLAGLSTSAVTDAFKTMSANVSIDLKGLTGEEVLAELNAVIGSQLDTIASQLFTAFDRYKKFGEGYLETVVRVVDGNNKVDQALRSLNSTFDVTSDNIVSTSYAFGTLTDKFDISESLIKAAGGLQEFMDQASYFADNFLTEQERLIPVTKSVNEQLNKLGVSTSTTRAEYKALVQGLDLTTTSGRALYQSLMDLAPGMDMVLKEQERIAEERTGLENKLLQLQGDTAALRKLDLAKLDSSNQALQEQIWLLEDQSSAAKNLKSSLENVTKTIKSQIQSLTDYKLALQTGASSTMTTSQQYAATKSEVDRLVALIGTTATTQEEVDARNAAIGKLTGTTDKFLTLSRTLFASGSQYTTDFNTVLDTVGSVSNILTTQQTDAEKQLTALTTANTYLENISNASKSTAELLSTYLAAGGKPITSETSTLPGFAVGTNYVPQDMVAKIHRGERIIPAADNANIMNTLANTDSNNREMVLEMKNLNQKIERLERVISDGAIINAAATDRNTEQLSQVITDSSGKTIQATRLQNKASVK